MRDLVRPVTAQHEQSLRSETRRRSRHERWHFACKLWRARTDVPIAETILVINAGSSSIKLSLYEIEDGGELHLDSKAQVDGIPGRAHLVARDAQGAVIADHEYVADDVPDVAAAMERAAGWLRDRLGGTMPVAVGHRVVHGGPGYTSPVSVDDAVLASLEGLVPLAPLHQPQNLAPIHAIRERFPGIQNVACFDTAFHRTHGEVADRYD